MKERPQVQPGSANSEDRNTTGPRFTEHRPGVLQEGSRAERLLRIDKIDPVMANPGLFLSTRGSCTDVKASVHLH